MWNAGDIGTASVSHGEQFSVHALHAKMNEKDGASEREMEGEKLTQVWITKLCSHSLSFNSHHPPTNVESFKFRFIFEKYPICIFIICKWRRNIHNDVIAKKTPILSRQLWINEFENKFFEVFLFAITSNNDWMRRNGGKHSEQKRTRREEWNRLRKVEERRIFSCVFVGEKKNSNRNHLNWLW